MSLGRQASMRSPRGLSGQRGLVGSAGLAAPSPPNMSSLELWQREGVRWLRLRLFALLADAMGLGKTATALRALRRWDRVIVVCPASVKITWRDECARWRPDLKVSFGELRRPERGELLVVSWDALPPPDPGSRVLLREAMGDVTLIGDECHMAKSDTADRTVRFRRLASQCGRVWGLTGTPMLGSPEDLWGVLVSLRLGTDLFACDCEEPCSQPRVHFIKMCGGRERWIYNRITRQRKKQGYTWGTVSPEVAARLRAGPMLRRDVSLLKLPPVRYQTLKIEAPEDLREHLDKVKRAWDDLDPNALPPFELISETRAALARARAPILVEWADPRATLDDPMLVFSDHADPVLAMGKLPGSAVILGATSGRERIRAVEAFQGGELRLLAMSVDAGGVGLNLQRAASVLLMDRPWTPGLIDQAIARAARKGQTRSVLVTTAVSDHPLDLRLDELLAEKRRLSRAALGD